MSVTLWAGIGAVWLSVSFWAGTDARTNSSHGEFLWAGTVFFGGIAGLLLYLNIGRDRLERADETPVERPDLVECPNCRAKEVADREVCRFCEAPLS